ncbi:uncharacterized protein F4822DRAFT_439246 [Hypoxylon trugodes]|uniref:uncharacterized protein n=1 Tax=Hypoxylon trugodes TaxID=326681 RepID=UPI00219DAA6C|nr:uncharacterized protein F4822DRAFT_439246 [Hypoxylon trugodes]KAI1382624.1 hypothetical protein F4822DRAFT_439246 [Hypoxylon trugodes]
MYYPTCAYACHDGVSQYQLSCSMVMKPGSMGGGHHPMGKFMTDPDCYATDDNFLRSVAYCISSRCSDVPVSDLEYYWTHYLVGRYPGLPSPKEPYSVALLHADPPPRVVVPPGGLLNTTTLVSDKTYWESYNSDSSSEYTETKQTDFGLVLLITGVCIPIACSLLRFIPFPRSIAVRFNAYIIEPPLFGRRHREPFYGLALVPTRGQALLIAYFITINVVFSCVDYWLVSSTSFPEPEIDAWMNTISNRLGVFCFANFALLILYAGRNNILLTITDWSYSTFLLLHRWIAIICVLEACIHSVMKLRIALDFHDFFEEGKSKYWIWGTIATLSFCLILPMSILPLRQKLYNLFLASHFALAFLALIACYYHVYYRYENMWGYETWIYIGFALWGFERFMRLARMARNGIKKATITVVDEQYLRVDIPGVTAEGHAYLYFPTLSFRVWENHPFSVMGTMMLQEPSKTPNPSTTTTGENISRATSDIEKMPAAQESTLTSLDFSGTSTPQDQSPSFKPGLTFFISSTKKGLTNTLRQKTTLPVLVESSYAATALDELRRVPNCIVIAGGVGIAAMGPLLRTRGCRTRLFWGARSQAFVEAVKASLGPDVLVPNIVGEIAVGRRINVRAILESEVVGEDETAVVVCGPVTMADEVRQVVCELGRKGRHVKLFDEAFSW